MFGIMKAFFFFHPRDIAAIFVDHFIPWLYVCLYSTDVISMHIQHLLRDLLHI